MAAEEILDGALLLGGRRRRRRCGGVGINLCVRGRCQPNTLALECNGARIAQDLFVEGCRRPPRLGGENGRERFANLGQGRVRREELGVPRDGSALLCPQVAGRERARAGGLVPSACSSLDDVGRRSGRRRHRRGGSARVLVLRVQRPALARIQRRTSFTASTVRTVAGSSSARSTAAPAAPYEVPPHRVLPLPPDPSWVVTGNRRHVAEHLRAVREVATSRRASSSRIVCEMGM